jgi:hypothetical protein
VSASACGTIFATSRMGGEKAILQRKAGCEKAARARPLEIGSPELPSRSERENSHHDLCDKMRKDVFRVDGLCDLLEAVSSVLQRNQQPGAWILAVAGEVHPLLDLAATHS